MMDNQSWESDLEGSGNHGLQGGADLDALIERSSLGDDAATSFYTRAVDAGEDESEVLTILASLDEQEAAASECQGSSSCQSLGSPAEPQDLSALARELAALRRGCAVHVQTQSHLPESVAVHARAALGAQRVALIRTLTSRMVLTVRRTSHTVFRSAQQLARYWIDTETLPPPASAPVLGLPGGTSGTERPEHEILDDTALVFDRSLFHDNDRRRSDPHTEQREGKLEVYWPSGIQVDHEMFLRQVRDFTYRVDLSPHTLTTPLEFSHPAGRSSSQYFVGLLWRVVDPKRTLRWRHTSFTLLLEAVLDEWRTALQDEVERKGRIERELRTKIAADSCWYDLGIEVSVQLCGQDRDGPMDRLDDGGLRFLVDAFRDHRRWFTSTFSEHQDPVGEPSLAAGMNSLPSGQVVVSRRSRDLEELQDSPYFSPPAGPYAPHGGPHFASRTPLFASSTESTGPMRRLI